MNSYSPFGKSHSLKCLGCCVASEYKEDAPAYLTLAVSPSLRRKLSKGMMAAK